MTDLTHPSAVLDRLADIENDLAIRQAALESAAMQWYRAKRDREKSWAEVFLRTEGTVAARNATADLATSQHGVEHEAEYEALRAVVRVLETRANIGMAVLKAQRLAA